MSKKLEEIAADAAAEWIKSSTTNHNLANACALYGYNSGYLAGYKAAQEQGTDNAENITLEDILGMTIEEYLHKHSEEIAEEVLNNNPLLKELKDE
jgi:hypothetical protein